MKILEYNSGNNIVDKILNSFPFCLDEDWVLPVISGAFGIKQDGKWKSGWLAFGNDKNESLFYNGLFYFRLSLPFWVGLHFRWCSDCNMSYLQTGFGWKGNGRFGILFRIQNDGTAAAGVHGPNYGQAQGWEDGAK